MDAIHTTLLATSTNADALEKLLKDGSLARSLVIAYRSETDPTTRLQAVREVITKRLEELRGKLDGAG